jgi:hypothetical protein
MDKKYHIRERTFLNLKTNMRAYVIGVVEDTRNRLACCKEHKSGGHIQLEIADCYEEIALHFDMSSRDERENSLYKIRKLAEVINAFHRALEIEIEAVNERETAVPHPRAMAAVHWSPAAQPAASFGSGRHKQQFTQSYHNKRGDGQRVPGGQTIPVL